MTATNETYLPTYEDLYVPPLNLTSPALRAGAFHLAMFCDVESKVKTAAHFIRLRLSSSSSFWKHFVKEFMLCKAEESQDPRKCLKYNKEVSLCASRFFHKVKESCAESFTNYWQCLDNAPEGQMSYKLLVTCLTSAPMSDGSSFTLVLY